LGLAPARSRSPRFTLTAGQRLDLGTIKIADVPQSSAGTDSVTLTFTARPR
jgi:hypothetical protein